jgi:hypothetical protein
MGAATALQYADVSDSIQSVAYDSPFISLDAVVAHVSRTILKIPAFLGRWLFKLACRRIEREIGIDLLDIRPIDYVAEKSTPAYFIASTTD